MVDARHKASEARELLGLLDCNEQALVLRSMPVDL
jgi:hypothetical protein